MRIASSCFLVSLTITTLFWSCQKEVNLQDDINTPGGGGGGTMNGDPGWSFTAAGNVKYYGCVDTAFYETISGIKTLSIEVTDSVDNTFSIILASTGNFTTTTYTPATGATMVFTSHDGNSYISSTASSFSIKVTSINDTLITAEFTATLSDPLGGGAFTISNGKLRALIGKHNGCGIDYGGGGNNGGGGSDDADYYLLDGPGNCTSAQLQGNYIKDSVLTQDHNVALDVYVDVEGKWTASTSTVNGIKFSGSGEFTSTGLNSIILQATGKPVATGSFELPLTAGTSVCKLMVEVDTLQIASCNPVNNSFNFEVGGIADGSFTQVNTLIDNGNYQISGHGPGDMQIQFPGPNQPDPGVYNIQQIGSSLSMGEAGVGITSTNIFWSPLDGQLHVSIVNGKVVATFCDVTFTGTLGNSYTSKVSAKITER